MGNTVRPRRKARVPAPPSESFGGGGATDHPRFPCPGQITALLRGSRLAGNAGTQVSVRELPSGDLVAVHPTLGTLGRLAGLDRQRRLCLVEDNYVGVVTEGRGNGPEVQLSRVVQP